MTRRLLLVAGGGGSFTTTIPTGDIPDQGQGLPGTFTKSPSNPIIIEDAGTWRDGWVDGVAIFRDTRINRWVVSVGGWDGTKYSTGLFYIDSLADVYAGTETPEEEPTNPVFSPPAGITNIVAWTTIQLPDLTYRAYWQNYGGGEVLHMCSSTDLVNWTHENGGAPVVSHVPGSWYETYAFDPYPVLLPDGTTRLIFAGQDHFGTRGIGYNLLDTDGITILSTGFLFYPDFPLGDISPAFGAPAALGSETRFGVFHDHRNFTFGTGRSIDRNWTDDGGATFTREADVLQPDGSGWDSVQVFDSAPAWEDGVLYLLHCAGNVSGDSTGINAKVGIAKMDWPLAS
jgi:hypothetical protein